MVVTGLFGVEGLTVAWMRVVARIADLPRPLRPIGDEKSIDAFERSLRFDGEYLVGFLGGLASVEGDAVSLREVVAALGEEVLPADDEDLRVQLGELVDRLEVARWIELPADAIQDSHAAHFVELLTSLVEGRLSRDGVDALAQELGIAGDAGDKTRLRRLWDVAVIDSELEAGGPDETRLRVLVALAEEAVSVGRGRVGRKALDARLLELGSTRSLAGVVETLLPGFAARRGPLSRAEVRLVGLGLTPQRLDALFGGALQATFDELTADGTDPRFTADDLGLAMLGLVAERPADATREELLRLARDDVGVTHQVGSRTRVRRKVDGDDARVGSDLSWLVVTGHLTAQAYGIDQVTAPLLEKVRRTMDLGRKPFGHRIRRWSEMQRLVHLIQGRPTSRFDVNTQGLRRVQWTDDVVAVVELVELLKHPTSGQRVRHVTLDDAKRAWPLEASAVRLAERIYGRDELRGPSRTFRMANVRLLVDLAGGVSQQDVKRLIRLIQPVQTSVVEPPAPELHPELLLELVDHMKRSQKVTLAALQRGWQNWVQGWQILHQTPLDVLMPPLPNGVRQVGTYAATGPPSWEAAEWTPPVEGEPAEVVVVFDPAWTYDDDPTRATMVSRVEQPGVASLGTLQLAQLLSVLDDAASRPELAGRRIRLRLASDSRAHVGPDGVARRRDRAQQLDAVVRRLRSGGHVRAPIEVDVDGARMPARPGEIRPATVAQLEAMDPGARLSATAAVPVPASMDRTSWRVRDLTRWRINPVLRIVRRQHVQDTFAYGDRPPPHAGDNLRTQLWTGQGGEFFVPYFQKRLSQQEPQVGDVIVGDFPRDGLDVAQTAENLFGGPVQEERMPEFLMPGGVKGRFRAGGWSVVRVSGKSITLGSWMSNEFDGGTFDVAVLAGDAPASSRVLTQLTEAGYEVTLASQPHSLHTAGVGDRTDPAAQAKQEVDPGPSPPRPSPSSGSGQPGADSPVASAPPRVVEVPGFGDCFFLALILAYPDVVRAKVGADADWAALDKVGLERAVAGKDVGKPTARAIAKIIAELRKGVAENIPGDTQIPFGNQRLTFSNLTSDERTSLQDLVRKPQFYGNPPVESKLLCGPPEVDGPDPASIGDAIPVAAQTFLGVPFVRLRNNRLEDLDGIAYPGAAPQRVLVYPDEQIEGTELRVLHYNVAIYSAAPGVDSADASVEPTESWKLAARLVSLWDHFDMVIGRDEEAAEHRGTERAHIAEVETVYLESGYEAAVERARALGLERGVEQPHPGLEAGGPANGSHRPAVVVGGPSGAASVPAAGTGTGEGAPVGTPNPNATEDFMGTDYGAVAVGGRATEPAAARCIGQVGALSDSAAERCGQLFRGSALLLVGTGSVAYRGGGLA